MKRSRFAKLFAAAVGIAGYGCQASPQTVSTIPTVVPPTPTPLAANMLGVSPMAGPPGPVTVWQRLGLGKQQREFCLRALCDSPAGALMSRAISPMSRLSGGLIPPLCSPIPTAGDLLDPGAIGANSKAKMDKANAEKRKKAVEELGMLDCHYWPEAEDALIGALRADRNECVRHTAALALNRGCCCTKKTIEALTICVTGSEADGHPCEKSARVRAAAAVALEACIERACCPACPIPEGAVPVEEKKDEQEKPKSLEETPGTKSGESSVKQIAWAKPGPDAVEDEDPEAAARKQAKDYYNAIKKKSMEEILDRARRGLATMPPLPIDLAVPIGHPDYEAAGVRTDAFSSANRPANVYDMLTGRMSSDAARFNHSPVIVKEVVIQSTVEPPATKVEIVKAAEPKTAQIKPAKAQPPATVAVPMPMPMPMPSEKVDVAISPLAMPVQTTQAAPAAPVQTKQASATVPVVEAPAAKQPVPAFQPAPLPAPKPLPAKTISNSERVLKMLDEPCDLGALRHAIESLTPAELKNQPKLMPALLQAAEYPSDSGIRVACLKAVQRGRMKVSEARPALERISRDRDAYVATEAARTLQELRTGH